MAHNIDTHGEKAAFVSRKDAWHQLGTTLDRAFTAEEAMQQGYLGGWNVRKAPVFAKAEDGTLLDMPDRYAVLRDSPFTPGQVDVLGNVGKSYKVIQNEAHAGLLDALVDESGAHFETAGALQGGKTVFITMRLPGYMKVGGADRIDNYIAAVNSHDGSSAFTFMVTPVRVVCQNTLNFAMEGAKNMFKVRHTTGADRINVQKARETLDLTFNYLDGFQQEAERLIDTTLTQVQFEAMITREFSAPKDAPKATITRTENKIDSLFELYADAYTQKEIKGTAWAAVNALTEWADHFSPVRGDAPDTTRATKSILEPGFKTRALELVRAEAGL